MGETCRECGAGLSDELEWCPRCQAPRTPPEPVYGQAGLPHRADQPPLRPWEWSQRGFGPRLRPVITLLLLVLTVFGLWYSIPFGLALVVVSAVVLWDVWRRHREWLD
jgi:hypothetical protein